MNFIKALWRLVQPIRNFFFKYPMQILPAYISFFKDVKSFRDKGGVVNLRYIAPYLKFKNNDGQTGGNHYFFQDIWALRILSKLKTSIHYDVGSRFDGFVGQATAICKVVCVDIRQPNFILPDFTFVEGSITNLPFSDNSLQSLSCLHTIEHVGLGRYGDQIDPLGYEKGLNELQRVLAPGGHLILSLPVGFERIEFNAQRVSNPIYPKQVLEELSLLEFSIVNDKGQFISHCNPEEYINARYSCGLYFFQKPVI